jgi:NADH:ubiquinone oxidoreductase subunit 2 (subunit N)
MISFLQLIDNSARFPLFEYPPNALIVITFVQAMTPFFAATTGILQNDLKRVIAYSTSSQLCYMIFACGISNYSVSVFHLMNHAFFKALLFLSSFNRHPSSHLWVIISMFNFEALLVSIYNFVIMDDGFTFFEILEGKYGLSLTIC